MRPYAEVRLPSPGAPPTGWGRAPVLPVAASAVWEHRNVSQPFHLGHGRRRVTTVVEALLAAVLAALLVGAAVEQAASGGSEPVAGPAICS